MRATIAATAQPQAHKAGKMVDVEAEGAERAGVAAESAEQTSVEEAEKEGNRIWM